MNQETEAQLWARRLEISMLPEAAAELRRLEAANAELLEALTHAVEIAEARIPGAWDDLLQYRAAIAKHGGAA